SSAGARLPNGLQPFTAPSPADPGARKVQSSPKAGRRRRVDPVFRCFGCDVLLDEQTRYCPHCGVRLDSGVAETDWPGAAEATAIYQRERPRLVGVAPQDTMLILGLLGAGFGAYLGTRNHFLVGGLVLLASAMTLLVFAEGLMRQPRSAIAQSVKTGLAL